MASLYLSCCVLTLPYLLSPVWNNPYPYKQASNVYYVLFLLLHTPMDSNNFPASFLTSPFSKKISLIVLLTRPSPLFQKLPCYFCPMWMYVAALSCVPK